jgi:peroxiredoxin
MRMPALGKPAPVFALPDTEGVTHKPGGAPATMIVFTCNHCPYALAWHGRIVAIARDYCARGVRVLAINPNDAKRYPRDSFEAMRARVHSGDFDGVPYLRDESQEVARAYDALKTPEVFILDASGALRYRGAPDADYEDPSQDAAYLRGALDAILDGREPEPAQTTPVGCSVKWLPEG